jgi:hypothetical protein
MSDVPPDRALLTEVQEGAEAMALLAGNEETFRAAVDAFRARDGESMQMLLARHKLGERCEVVCHWLRSKECVLTCLELSGPPALEEEPPDVREFAEIVAKVTVDEELVQEIVIAIEERDHAAWGALVKQHELERYSHLLCHWACTVYYRLVCSVVCQPVVEQPREPVPELQAAGQAIGRIAADEKTFAAAVEAVRANNCEELSVTLAQAELAPVCRLICEWFCSWRCMLVCLRLCRVFPIERPESSIEEALEFAQAVGRLAAEPGTLERLSAAVLREDVETVQGLAKEFEFERYCIQFCHWVCFLRCQLFCTCVCPPADTTPLFTHVGIYQIPTLSLAGDFAPDGTTNAGSLAFTQTIPLSGVMPDGQASQAYEYRFLISEQAPAKSAPAAAEGAQVAPTTIGQLEFWAYDNSSSVWYPDTRPVGVNTSFAPYAIPQPGKKALPPIDLNVAVGPEGWIPVPRMNDYTQGGIGRFVPGGGLAGTDALINLDTTQFTNENINLGALQAGDSIPKADLSPRPTYTIAFEARVIATKAPVAKNELPTIAFSNTRYEYTRHPEWDGGPVAPPTITVCSVDVLELREGSGCNHLIDTVTALFTCYHPYLGSGELFLQGPGIPYPPVPGPYTATLPLPAYGPGAVEAASGLVGHVFDISGLASCAYILHLRTAPNLTEGDGAIGYVDEDLLAFCTG